MNMKVLFDEKKIVSLANEVQPKYLTDIDSDFQYMVVQSN